MNIIEIILIVWTIVAIVFFSMIRFEAARNGVGFAGLQAVVALFWPFWLLWYLYIIVTDKFRR